MPFSLFLPFITLISSVIGAELRINGVDEFIQFKNNVNGGTNYEGTTVFLDSDLSLDEKTFEPIGSTSSYFRGIFDGQGHVISNLVMTSSSQYVGLFGYSQNLTIRNIILDSSCTLTSSYSSSSGYETCVGGIIGYCYGYSEPCTIENSVNMGSVSFTGNIGMNHLYLGGIAGYFRSYSYNDLTVKNCANYGDVTHSGTSDISYIGGILGYSYGRSSANKTYIYNSLNYGTITHGGTTSSILRLGGISGYSTYTTIEGCVSAGKISSTVTTNNINIGSVVGYASDTSITHCLWKSDVGCDSVNGGGSPSVTDTSLITTLNTAMMNELNNYAENKDSTWSRWVMLHLNGGSISNINQDTQISGLVESLPVPVKEGYTFDHWCVNEACNEVYNPSTSEMSSVTDLYAHWTTNQSSSSFTVTFDGNGGESISFTSKKVTYNSAYGELPEVMRTGCTFAGWFTERTGGEEVVSRSIVTTNSDHTLYAHWTINQYTLTFEANGGSECPSITQDYNKLVTLPKPVKTGYTFVYWCSDPKLTIQYTGTTMPAENKTLYAHWTINQYTLTLDFGNGTVSSVVLPFNATVEYPEEMTREGLTFAGWTPNPERMPAENITVKAQWNTETQFTLTFDFGNGTVNSVVLDFNATINYPEDVTREGFNFARWSPKPERMPAENITVKAQWTTENQFILTFDFGNGTVNSVVLDFNTTINYPEGMTREGFNFAGWSPNPERMPAENITVKAQWTITSPENPTYSVEIVFSEKDLSEKEIKDIIQEFVPDGTNFTIAKIESESGETTAIIKFTDKETAKSFVETIRASSDDKKSIVKRVEFSYDIIGSFSLPLSLNSLVTFMICLTSF